jgi:hypothetical protein
VVVGTSLELPEPQLYETFYRIKIDPVLVEIFSKMFPAVFSQYILPSTKRKTHCLLAILE